MWHWKIPSVIEIDIREIIGKGITITLVIILAVVINLLMRRALARLAKRLKAKMTPAAGDRAVTLTKTTASFASYAIFFTAAISALTIAGVIEKSQVLVGAGMVGLAIGFGTQALVRDVVSGFFALLEEQYGVGDIVEINGVMGVIEEVGLRVTKLRDVRGQLYFFPNGAISSVNRFPHDGLLYNLHVPAAQSDLDKSSNIINETLDEFNRQFQCFTNAARQLANPGLPGLAYQLQILPFRQAFVLEKLPAHLAFHLKQQNSPLPEGSEIVIVPKL